MFVVFDSTCSPNTSDYVLAAPAAQTIRNDYEYRDALISVAELLDLRLPPPKWPMMPKSPSGVVYIQQIVHHVNESRMHVRTCEN